MKRSTSFFTLLVTAAALSLMVAGCLISEEDEYTVKLNADGKSGSIWIVKRNVQSDQAEKGKQWEDFLELVKNWRSDEYLLDKTKEGIYVKERTLASERGKLVWREYAIFADFHEMFKKEIEQDTLKLSFDNDQTIVSTNGTVVRDEEKTFVLWPTSAKEFKLRIKQNKFTATSDMAGMFKKFKSKKQP